MIKKMVMFVLISAYMFILVGCNQSIKGTEGLVFTEVVDLGYKVTGYEGTNKNVVIPASYNDKRVFSIGNAAFYNNSNITSITMLEGIESIGEGAFYECTSLKSVHIPASVKSIGYGAFSAATALKTITFAEGSKLTSIGPDVFYGAMSLTSIDIPASVTNLSESSQFHLVPSLTSINVSNDNQYYSSIDGVLFNKDQTRLIRYPEGNTNSTYVIPSSVTSIASDAFRDAQHLEDINIPSSVTSIDNRAFAGVKTLKTVSFEEGSQLTRIESGTFEEASSLASIVIPLSVIYIGYNAFGNATSLTIYAEVNSKPSGWNLDWNPYNCPVVWGYIR